VTSTVHVPPATTTVAYGVPATVTVTAEPTGASVVPDSVGVASLVASVAPPLMVTAGPVVSTVSVCAAVPVLPSASVVVTVTACGPSARALAT